jgi:DNA end-binding protein Ku
VSISDKELEMSSALVDSFASDFTPEDYSDAYQEQLRTLIDAKLEHGESLDTEATFGEAAEEPAGGEVIDLMEALRRSVEKNRPAKSGAAKSTAAKSSPPKSAEKKTASAAKTTGGEKPAPTKADAAKSAGRKTARSDDAEEASAAKRPRTRKGA